MNKKLQVAKYLFSDAFAASLSWTLFYIFRKRFIESAKFGSPVPVVFDNKFYSGLLFILFFWITLYVLTGTYNKIFRKSRLKEVGQTLLISLIGVMILFLH